MSEFRVRVVMQPDHFLENMLQFHRRNAILEKYFLYQNKQTDISLWRFSEFAYAIFFIAEFGGTLLAC
jgi:hypothetical protein